MVCNSTQVAEGEREDTSKTGSCTYCACIAKVAFLSVFQFFFVIYTTYPPQQ